MSDDSQPPLERALMMEAHYKSEIEKARVENAALRARITALECVMNPQDVADVDAVLAGRRPPQEA